MTFQQALPFLRFLSHSESAALFRLSISASCCWTFRSKSG